MRRMDDFERTVEKLRGVDVEEYHLESEEAVASCLYTQIPESRINTELFNYHQKTE